MKRKFDLTAFLSVLWFISIPLSFFSILMNSTVLTIISVTIFASPIIATVLYQIFDFVFPKVKK